MLRSPKAPNEEDLIGETIQNFIDDNKVVIFSKTFCPYCKTIKDLFDNLKEPYKAVELDNMGDGGEAIKQALYIRTNQKTVPNVFVNKKHIGTCDETLRAYKSGELQELLAGKIFDYDLIVVGGGSGGLAASKEAASLGKKVLVCDFVTPTPKGTTWGLGGTCVNVGCIPKKLMHKAGLLGADFQDAPKFGWQLPEKVEHNWNEMVTNIQNYIKSLNWGYRKVLKERNITYKNAFAKFTDINTVELKDKAGRIEKVTGRHFIIACGGRPNYPDIEGAEQYGITSDDLFSLPYHPGKCLIIGGSYIALECAGFLKEIGVDVTVMVRSILLRGFDQQMAEMVGSHMESIGVEFLRPCVPMKVEQLTEGTPGLYKVAMQNTETHQMLVREYNTVVFAIGRTACTKALNIDKIGVTLNSGNSKIIVDNNESTTVSNIHAIGDVIHGKLELTPVAIKAGQLLARRLYGNSEILMDYINVPTTVFTPLEYGFVGLSEEDANAKYGEENIEVYHTFYNPLEFALSQRDYNKCYAKLVCLKTEQERVVGLHIFGPNAGEITQGFAIGVRLNGKRSDFSSLVGIHPTDAENFTTMNITKASKLSVQKTDC